MPALNGRNRTSKAIPNDKVDQPLGEKKNGQTAVQYHKKIVYGTAISSSSATSTSENADDS